jgi:hypothetical protein
MPDSYSETRACPHESRHELRRELDFLYPLPHDAPSFAEGNAGVGMAPSCQEDGMAARDTDDKIPGSEAPAAMPAIDDPCHACPTGSRPNRRALVRAATGGTALVSLGLWFPAVTEETDAREGRTKATATSPRGSQGPG